MKKTHHVPSNLQNIPSNKLPYLRHFMSWSWGILKFLDGMPTSYSPTLIRSVLAAGLAAGAAFSLRKSTGNKTQVPTLPVPVRLYCM